MALSVKMVGINTSLAGDYIDASAVRNREPASETNAQPQDSTRWSLSVAKEYWCFIDRLIIHRLVMHTETCVTQTDQS